MGHQDWYGLSSPDGHRAGQRRKLLLGFSAKVKVQVVITRVGSNSVGSEGAHTLRDLRPTVLNTDVKPAASGGGMTLP